MKKCELDQGAMLSRIGNIITAPKTKDGKVMDAQAAIVAAKDGVELVYDAAAVPISDDEVSAGKGEL